MTRPASFTDRHWMKKALALARKGQGFTRPNPPVGAVIVKHGKMIGSGFHAHAGGAHAEIAAIEACRVSPRGATLFVTLEPCSTTGRTPPCSERLVREGLGRVCVATIDPNPRHAGRGLDLLRSAGIPVETGLCEDEARSLIAPFAKWIVSGRPWVTLKLAMTLDGCIADRTGRSKWITGPASRRVVQHWRRCRDVVMVGAGTALADDPSLRCNQLPEPPTLRLVVDGRGVLPDTARVLRDGHADRTMIATTGAAPSGVRSRWADLGARVWVLPSRRGHVDLESLLACVGECGCCSLLCEGGAGLAGALVKAGLVDDYLLFYAPRLLADGLARHALNGNGFRLSNAPGLKIIRIRRMGDDLCLYAIPAVESQS